MKFHANQRMMSMMKYSYFFTDYNVKLNDVGNGDWGSDRANVEDAQKAFNWDRLISSEV